MKNQKFAIRLQFALKGIRHAIRTEASFRTQVIFAIGVIGFLGFARPEPVWWALILICIGGVLTAELFNTALETIIDHLHPSEHPLIGVAKDCAAGAVLFTSLTSVLVFIAMCIATF